ncbi:hypothetical protein WJX84_001872 [Apatococcus fuscideae]|uniref:Uncharacterized protein n=1 Tax=Apatococcus fuscideae TaxID=2026836 RepID=A0AAW1SWP8_9CHLO
MPLLKRKPYQPSFTAPEGFNLGAEVFVVRFTGELFTSYEDYARALKLYRTRDWVCQLTGRSGLSYEEALVSEQRSRTLIAKFPACYEEPVVRMVHHALAKPDEIVTRLLAHFKERLVPGEEAIALRSGTPAACVVAQCLGPDGLDADEIDELQVLDMEYEVEWLQAGEDEIEGVREVLARSHMGRKRSPLTRPLLKSWLQEAATCEPLEGTKGPPCFWSVIPELASKWGLPQQPPRDLLERIDQAAKKKAAKGRRSSEKVVRPRKSPVMKSEAYGGASPSGEAHLGDTPLLNSLRSLKAEEGYEGSPETAPELMDPALEERLEEAEQRMQPGTIKHALFYLLKEAGPRGSTLEELVTGVQDAGLKTWTDMRIAKSSIASTCGHDLAFGRLPHGRFALRGLPGVRQALASHPDSANFGAAAAKLKQGRGGVKPEPGRAPSHTERDRISTVEKNNFKCPRCYKVHHPEASPLLLCDTCPRSFHMACLGLSWHDLPEGEAEWYCPRCIDRHAAASRNLGYASDMAVEGGQRVVPRLTEKEERERRKADERAAKEEVRIKEREQKERARAEARRAARFPIDDLELQEEERAVVEALEAAADQLSQEAHIARQRLQRLAGLCGHNLAQLDPAEDWGLEELGSLAAPPEDTGRGPNHTRRPDLSTAVDNLMGLQQRAAEAVDKANKLQLIVDGPPQLEVALTASSLAGWRDSLSVVDFLHCFAPLCDTQAVSLAELNYAAAWPLDSPLLPPLYTALLSRVLLELVGTESSGRSRWKRWARVLDETTWPEVLRRYLLSSRAARMLGRMEIPIQSAKAACLEDDMAAVWGAHTLITTPYHKLDPALHVRLLAVLCNDVVEGAGLRHEISARADDQMQLHTDRQHTLNQERKQQKERDKDKTKKGKADPAIQDAGLGLADVGLGGEDEDMLVDEVGAEQALEEPGPSSQGPAANGPEAGPEPSFEMPSHLQEYQGDPDNRQEVRAWRVAHAQAAQEVAAAQKAWERQKKAAAKAAKQKAAQARAAALSPLREAERAARDLEFEGRLAERSVRSEPMGCDRYFRRYWWLPGEPGALYVEEADGSAVALVTSTEQLDSIMTGLNRKGLRERGLLAALRRKHSHISAALDPDSASLDLRAVPRVPVGRGVRERGSKPLSLLEATAEKNAMRGATLKVEALIGALSGAGASLPQTSKEWRRRLRNVDAPFVLCQTLAEIEEQISNLADGPPAGAPANLPPWPAYKAPPSVEPSLGPQAYSRAFADADICATMAEQWAKPQPAQAVEPRGVSALVPEGYPPAVCGPDPCDTAPYSSPGWPPLSLKPSESYNGAEEAIAASPRWQGETSTPHLTPFAMEQSDREMGTDSPGLEPTGSTASGLDGSLAEGRDSREEDAKWVTGPPPDSNGTTIAQPAEAASAGSTFIYPCDELDCSDEEAARASSEHRRMPNALWRTARERGVWLKDVRLAATGANPAAAAYVAAVLCDRAQPLLQSLEQGTRQTPTGYRAIKSQRSMATASTDAEAPASKRSKPTARRKSGGRGRARMAAVSDQLGVNDVSPDPQRQATPMQTESHPAEPGTNGAAGINVCCVCQDTGDLLPCKRDECTQHVHEACAFEGLDPDSGLWACDQHMSQFGTRAGRRGSAGARKRRKGPIEATFLSPHSAESPVPDPLDSSADPLSSPPAPAAVRGRRGRPSTRSRGRGRKAQAARDPPQMSLNGIAAQANGLALDTDPDAAAGHDAPGPEQPLGEADAADPVAPGAVQADADALGESPKPARGRRGSRKSARS